jgi:hypothetical protein
MKKTKSEKTNYETSGTTQNSCEPETERTGNSPKGKEAKFRNIVNNAIEGIFQRSGRLFHSRHPSFARIHGYDSPADIKNSIKARDLFVTRQNTIN